MKKTLIGLIVALAVVVCGSTAFAVILKPPYLIYPGQNTTMEVLWQDTQTETTNTVCWYSDQALTQQIGCQNVLENNATDNQHIYTITGLTPATTYYYQVTDTTNGVYGTGSFLAAPASNATSAKFLLFGDTRTYPTAYDAVLGEMYKFIQNDPTYQGLTVHAGDWVTNDTEATWTHEWFSPSLPDAINLRLNMPIDGVKGNHEASCGEGSIPGFSIIFPKYMPFPYMQPNMSVVTTFQCPGTPVVTLRTNGVDNAFIGMYGSFDYGPVHFTMVDQYSNYAPGSTEYNWIITDLSSTTQPWKIVMYHEPSWSCDGNSAPAQNILDPIISQYGVDMVLMGHDHSYCRAGVWNSAQANGDTIAPKVAYVTSGGGGAPLYGVDLTNTSSAHIVVGDNEFNFASFNVQGKTLTMNDYQVNNVSLTSVPSASSPTSHTLVETLVLNHFTDVTAQTSVYTTGLLYSRASKMYVGSMTVTNNGPALTGNIDVSLNNILALQNGSNPGVTNINPSATDPNYLNNGANTCSSSSSDGSSSSSSSGSCGVQTTVIASNNGLITNVTLVNATGQNNSAPMIRVSTSGLASGASVTVPVQFSNPSNATITFSPAVLQE
jgi:hypothetical protein